MLKWRFLNRHSEGLITSKKTDAKTEVSESTSETKTATIRKSSQMKICVSLFHEG